MIKMKQILSGGQTGADRAALDAAIDCGVPHGGFCPSGRRAEDGPISKKYNLTETESEDYPVRTEANVLAADLTLILSRGPLTGGSLLTQELAARHGRPCLHVDLTKQTVDLELLESAVPSQKEIVLNIAGPRASGDPGIYDAVYQTVTMLLK